MFGWNSTSPEEKAARKALGGGDPQTAYAALRPLLDYPGKLPNEKAWKSAWLTFAEVADAITGPELGELARRAAAAPRDADALYSFGYGLVEQSLHGAAATVLSRAHDLAPTEEALLTELVCAFEGMGRNDLAREVLTKSGMAETSFLPRYLLSFNILMQGNLVESKKWHQGLDQLIDREDEHASTLAFMEASLDAMYRRAEQVRAAATLDLQDLRGWSYVVNDCLLLHLSEYGKDEGMNGRYAYLQESPELLADGLNRLRMVFSRAKIAPSCVFAPHDRDSEILARLAARALNCEMKPWSPSGASEPGLIVCYDLTKLDPEVAATLAMRHPGQFLWCHACQWTESFPISPEIVTYFHQITSPPWGERLSVNPETREVQKTPALPGTSDQVAALISTALPRAEEDDDFVRLIAFASRTRLFGEQPPASESPQPEPRHQFRKDSPVKSSRFM